MVSIWFISLPFSSVVCSFLFPVSDSRWWLKSQVALNGVNGYLFIINTPKKVVTKKGEYRMEESVSCPAWPKTCTWCTVALLCIFTCLWISTQFFPHLANSWTLSTETTMESERDGWHQSMKCVNEDDSSAWAKMVSGWSFGQRNKVKGTQQNKQAVQGAFEQDS